MYHFFIDYPVIPDEKINISGSDYNHIVNVLRIKKGEEVIITDSLLSAYKCIYEEADKDSDTAYFSVISKAPDTELPVKIVLYQGMPKSDKLETVIQKAIELGAFAVAPVDMKRSIVKLDDKKKASRLARWQAISESAAKQSGRCLIPKVMPVMSLDEALKSASGSVILFAYEAADGMKTLADVLSGIRPGQSISVFIGPEGGFDPSEADKITAAGGITVSLGKRILRTETAGPALIAALMLQSEIISEAKHGDLS